MCVIIMNRTNILVSKELDCSKNGLYKNATLNGRTGYALTTANNNRRLGTVYNVTRGVKKVSPGIARLGGGTQGVVYLACTSPRCDHNIVIKVSPRDKMTRRQSAQVEYDIQKTLYKIVKNHIPVPYKLVECKNFAPVSDFTERNLKMFNYTDQFVLYSEYAHGGTLKEWIRKLENRLTDDDMARMVFQVLSTLRRIYSRYPEFRHNDLHLGNVLVDDTTDFPRLMITDFGLSRLKSKGSNPIVDAGNFERVGISSRTSDKYDMHYFLNSLGYEIRHMKHFQRTKEFIVRTIPKEYLGMSTAYVKEYRLRMDVPVTAIPSLDKVIQDPYFKSEKPSRPTEVTSPKVRIHGDETSAASIARTALSGMPGVTVTTVTSARKPTAAEFLRMSPRSRAKYKTKTRAEVLGESRVITTKNVIGKKGNIVERRRRVAATNARKYLAFEKPPASLSPIFKTPAPRTVKLTNVIRLPRTPRSLGLKKMKKRGSGPKTAPSRVAAFKLKKKKSTTPPPLPRVTERERRAARKALKGRKTPAKPPSKKKPAPPPPLPPKRPTENVANARLRTLLNTLSQKNGRLTSQNYVQHLRRIGVSTPRATSFVQKWKAEWNKSRRNVSLAVQKIRNGKNLAKLGFPNSVRRVAQRRVNARLTNIPNGRVRASGKLLESRKKEELVSMAQRYGIHIEPKMTKEKIIRALFG